MRDFLFDSGKILTVDVDVLDFLCLYPIVSVNYRLSLGRCDVKLENNRILSGSHITNMLIGNIAFFYSEVAVYYVFDIKVIEALQNVCFIVNFQDMLCLLK